MQYCTLASGSSGNAALVSCGNAHVLVDAGISMRRIVAVLKALDLTPQDISGIFLTHSHRDHTAGLQNLVKYFNFTLFSQVSTAETLCRTCPELYSNFRVFKPGKAFSVGDVEVKTFETPHDVPSVGYRIGHGGQSLAIATDLGFVPDPVLEAISGADAAIIETNHDPDLLRSGPYPPYLQDRILGDHGHLSNAAGADLAVRLAQSGTRQLLLAHLSRENNRPELAYETTAAALERCGALPGRDLQLSVAPRDAASLYRRI